MAKKSARLLGYEVGLGPHDMNLALEEAGFLKKGHAVTRNGSPVWEITEKGKEYGCQGSYSAIWDECVLDKIRENRK